MNTPALNMVELVDLTPSDALLPILECVSNSIISLSQSGLPPENRRIDIKIDRYEDSEEDLFSNAKPIKDVLIIDNGIGFTDTNFLSFETPHSNILRKYGCLGVGRFTVLAAFRKMKVRSNYRQNGGWKYREFDFDTKKEVKPISYKDSTIQANQTEVELKSCFNDIILERTAITVEEIAKAIMEHFLIYYLSNNLPVIWVSEMSDSSKTKNVNELYNDLSKENERNFKVSKEDFRIYITRHPKTTNRKNHYVHYCADSRVVGRSKSLGRIDSIFSYPLSKNTTESFLDVYVVSPYLDKKKTSTRNAFLIPNERDNGLFGKTEISFQDIEIELAKILKDEYAEHVKRTQERNISEWKQYISTNPRFNSILNDAEILNSLPSNTSDEKKEEHLHRIIHTKQKKVETRIQQFIDDKKVNENSIQTIISDLRTKTILDTDSLTDYMFRRKAVIDLFERFLKADEKGEYKLESDIHNLIFPMGVTSKEINYEAHNLWLLDERLVSFQFIASDKPIRSFCDTNSPKEPDLVALNSLPTMFDNPIGFGDKTSGELSALVIFEFKRPGETASNMKKNNRWEFNDLTDKYFDAFRYGDKKVQNRGRSVIVRDNTPKFGYIILDVIPEELEDYNLRKDWHRTPFGTYYKLVTGSNMHLEAMTFDNLLKFAKHRHNPFFDRLFITK